MASWLARMAARRIATFARICATRSASHIPRRGLAGAAEHHGPPKANLYTWKKGHSLIVLFAGCGLVSFGGYELAIKNSKNFAKGILKETDSNSLMDLFEWWREENGKTYKSPEEKMRRFEVFKANVKYVEGRNEGLTTKKIGLNHFLDLDSEDYMQAGYLKDLFEWWIKEMKAGWVRSYDSPEEKLHRFEVFKSRVEFAEEHNKKSTYMLGLNPLSDMEHDEILRIRGLTPYCGCSEVTR